MRVWRRRRGLLARGGGIGAGTNVDGLGERRKQGEAGAKLARGVAPGVEGKSEKLLLGERRGINVGVKRVRVVAILRSGAARQSHERIPEAT